jgi:hypothetical protein
VVREVSGEAEASSSTDTGYVGEAGNGEGVGCLVGCTEGRTVTDGRGVVGGVVGVDAPRSRPPNVRAAQKIRKPMKITVPNVGRRRGRSKRPSAAGLDLPAAVVVPTPGLAATVAGRDAGAIAPPGLPIVDKVFGVA